MWDVSVEPEPCAQTLADVSGCESLSQITRPEDTEHIFEEKELDTLFLFLLNLYCVYITPKLTRRKVCISQWTFNVCYCLEIAIKCTSQ